MKQDILVGIDIGRTKICVAVAEAKDSSFSILDFKTVRHNSLKNGVVVDMDSLSEAILGIKEDLEEKNKFKITSSFVNISGSSLIAENVCSQVIISSRGSEISEKDIQKALDLAKSLSVPLDRELIHIFVHDYIVDGQSGIRDPVGLYATKLEVNCFVITARYSFYQNLIRGINFAGIDVDALVLTSIADSFEVLDEQERTSGALLIDIGGDITEVSIFKDNQIKRVEFFEFGGETLVDELSQHLRITYSSARAIIEEYYTLSDLFRDGYQGDISANQNIGGVSVGEVIRILDQSIDNFVRIILQRFSEFPLLKKINTAVVLGGPSRLYGFAEKIGDAFCVNCRMSPFEYGLNSSTATPTALGLLKYGLVIRRDAAEKTKKGFLGRIYERSKTLLSEYF